MTIDEFLVLFRQKAHASGLTWQLEDGRKIRLGRNVSSCTDYFYCCPITALGGGMDRPSLFPEVARSLGLCNSDAQRIVRAADHADLCPDEKETISLRKTMLEITGLEAKQ